MLALLLSLPAAAAPCPGDDPPVHEATVSRPSLDEISGLVVAPDGGLWVLEDSGNAPVVSRLEASGARTTRTRLDDTPNRDWEDLGIGPCPAGTCLFVAEIGDNDAIHPDVSLYRFPVPSLTTRTVEVEGLRFRYPEGPQDAEALVVDAAGRAFVFTKRGDDTSRVYQLPEAWGGDAVGVATRLADLPVGIPGREGRSTRVTGAALRPDGWLLLRSYVGLSAYAPAGSGWDPASRVMLPVAEEPQGEAVAWDPSRGGYWTISEAGWDQRPPRMWFRACAGDNGGVDR